MLQNLQPHISNSTDSALKFEDWGLIEYSQALEKQLKYVDAVASGSRPDTVIFCTHPPVVTLGRATEEGDVTNWSGDVIEVSRGGRATYHGPDQLVIYPILNLNNRGRDLHKHLRFLECAVSEVLKSYGLEPIAIPDATGVWIKHLDENQSVMDRKICSIGIAVKKWVTYHGVSLAVDKSETAYSGINPCGFTRETMISLEEVLGHKISREDLIKRCLLLFTDASS